MRAKTTSETTSETPSKNTSVDTLTTLWFPQANARAHLVRLGPTWQRIAQQNPCAGPVQAVLGHMVAASGLMSASLKFSGSVVIQVHSTGPVRLLMAECNHRLGVRGTLSAQQQSTAHAKTQDNLQHQYHAPDQQHGQHPMAAANLQTLLNPDGKGLCTIVLDPQTRQPGQAPYQGMVPLRGQTMAEVLQSYMQQSEQIASWWVLHSNAQYSAGLLLQQMPSTGGLQTEVDPDAWPRLLALVQTLQETEQLETDPQTLAIRLFWEENPHILATRTVQFECSCSRNKVTTMLQNLGQAEVEAALADQPTVQVDCHFCGANYVFNAKECAALFT